MIFSVGVSAQSGFGTGEKPIDPAQQAEPLPDALDAPTDAVSDADPVTPPFAEEHRAPIALAPSAFTPNGDGLNDKFYPRIGEVVTQGYLFHVFDRWGREIYSTNNPGEGWDGSLSNSGPVLPQGIYVWRLVFQPLGSAESIKRMGSVALLL
ncbi:MAG: gliding motility-associated C-terminal domain-containing protein [Flavobacteriales bacterium]|nr:gliding motility-associated C-terminal domain-containing protein [Flavobacteriales bacterium]